MRFGQLSFILCYLSMIPPPLLKLLYSEYYVKTMRKEHIDLHVIRGKSNPRKIELLMIGGKFHCG